MKPGGLAPILLFVFCRADHARKTLQALAANELASDSDLIVYADAARHEGEKPAVEATRAVVRAAQGFRSVTLVERPANFGLARNIIEGVSDLCARHGRVIVLEDDIVTSPQFLAFMNAALDKYKDDSKVWHVSGWNYPMDTAGLDDAFFLRVMNCWGWATWADRWQYFEKNPGQLVKEFDRKSIAQFDLEGTGVFWSQVLGNLQGRLNTWAIFWYATIFKHQGLCLNPAVSYVENIGFDGTGTHTGTRDSVHSSAVLCTRAATRWPPRVEESALGIDRVRHFYRHAIARPSLPRRVAARLRRLLGLRPPTP